MRNIQQHRGKATKDYGKFNNLLLLKEENVGGDVVEREQLWKLRKTITHTLFGIMRN
jgi:hypothetical protein